jgi:flagellar basal body rod protein FlgC
MDHLSIAGQVSAAGMTAQRRRLEVLAGNLVNSTRSYEANLQARKSTGAMKDSALEILK